MKDQKIKHLEIIQGVITRMAGNSFLIKGWSVTIATALFALAAKDANARFAILALFPTLVLWGLDAYYLRQERIFRKLYDNIRSLSDEEWSTGWFSLDTANCQKDVDCWSLTLWSPTIVAIHGSILLLVFIVMVALVP